MISSGVYVPAIKSEGMGKVVIRARYERLNRDARVQSCERRGGIDHR